MNERIRELMIRAISDVDSIDDPETRRMYIPNCFAEKFAELMVRECCDIVRQCRFAPDEDAIVNEIVQHFGVEE